MIRYLLILISLSLLPLSVPSAWAYSASLTFSPSSGTKYVGNTFAVTVLTSTGGVSANSFQADFRFPIDKLEVTSISTGGSVCSLFPFQPSYSNASGTGSITCGLPSPGYNGSGGKIGTINFRAKTTGSATISIANSSQVLANDGAGTNILTTLGSGTFTISQPPTSAPVVTSSTHPSETSWYKERVVTLSWSGGYSGYSYEFNQTLETIPDQVSEGGATTKTYNDVRDGVWYFSIRGNGSSGWSGTTHFKVQVDNVAPDPFVPVSDPAGEADRRPLISFQTSDATSGIDHYEIKIDSGDFFRVENPYKPDRISSGEHTFTVRAVDRAGNYTDGTVKVRIKEIASPTITRPTGGYLKFLEKLKVEGTARAESVVSLYLNDKKIAQEITVGKDGKWEYEHTETLFPSKYKLYAVVTHDGIESRPSNEVSFEVDASVVSLGPLTLPGALVITVLLILLILALAAAGYFAWQVGHRAYSAVGNFRDKMRGLKEEVAEDMTKLEHQVERDVEETLQDSDSAKMRSMEHALENRVEKDIEATKGHLKGDIDKAEGEMGKP